MTTSMTEPITLITGAAGQVGGVGRMVAELLLAKRQRVRAHVRREDERSAALARLGAEVVAGDLLDLDAVHRAIIGCRRVYFGLSISSAYLEATTNMAAMARHHGIDALVNISQMTVSQMSVNETTSSPQQKLHWLSEQILNWSGLPVVHIRPTVFLDGLFLRLAASEISQRNALALPFGHGRTSPIAAFDVARVITAILVNPDPHIGNTYELTGPIAQNMEDIAGEYAAALGRPIRYDNVPLGAWRQRLVMLGLPEHLVNHLHTMALLHQQNRFERLTYDVEHLTGSPAMTVQGFVGRHAHAFDAAPKR